MDKELRLFTDGAAAGAGLAALVIVSATATAWNPFAPVYPAWIPIAAIAAMIGGVGDAWHLVRNSGAGAS